LQAGGHPIAAYAEPVPDAAALRAYAAVARWRKENGGMTIGGLTVATDDRSKALIQGAYLQAQRDPAFTAQWKTASGSFAIISAAEIEAVALAVSAHIQACFAKEAEVVQDIDNHVIDTFAQIDAAFDALT
jgi:predicted secreted acid phosphatase